MPDMSPPGSDAKTTKLDDRIAEWLAEGQAIERAIQAEITAAARAQEALNVRLASVRDAIDRMREVVASAVRG